MSVLNPSNIPDPRDFAGYLIWQKSNNWEKYVNQQIKTFGITQTELFNLISLKILSLTQDEVTQVDLAKFTSTSAMSVSKTLKILEKNSFIVRKIGTDPRSKAIQITSKAETVLIESAQVLKKADETFFPSSNKNTFVSYLKSLN
jgi:DNA-binding MarR family transcriptional regulator